MYKIEEEFYGDQKMKSKWPLHYRHVQYLPNKNPINLHGLLL